jgi:ankyrin repeat protein
MKIKNIIPYIFANQILGYNSIYVKMINMSFNNEIKENLRNKNYYQGEVDLILYLAINHKNLDIVNFIYKEFPKINKNRKECIFEATKMNIGFIVENYLKTKPPKNKFLFTLLDLATLHSSQDVVKLLLNYGIDYTQEDNICLRTILKSGNFELFKIYHQYGLKVNKEEYLFSAIQKDNADWFQYIINNGLDINNINKDVILNFIGFAGAINIMKANPMLLMEDKELMFKSIMYNPLGKEFLQKYYEKVDFYKKIENKLISTKNTKTKVNKI